MPEKLLEAKAPEVKIEKQGLTLLWTNSNPYTSMSPTTISIDASGYAWLLLMCKGAGKSGASNAWMTSVILTDKNQTYSVSIHNQTDSGVWQSRYFTWTDSGLTVGSGKQTNPFGNERNADNTACVPYKIYGFK